MSDQQQKEVTNLESCKRLQALSNYRESEDDTFEAFSVLNDALFYLNPKSFSPSGQCYNEANKLRVEILNKQGELCLRLKKPQKAIQVLKQLAKNVGAESKVLELKRKLINEGVNEEQLKENIIIQ